MAEDFKLALELVTPAFQERQAEVAQHAAQRRLKANEVRLPNVNFSIDFLIFIFFF